MAAEMNDDDTNIMDSMRSFNLNGLAGTSLLCRFQQEDELHEQLRRHLFSEESKQNLCDLLNHSSTIVIGQVKQHITRQNITSINIRFATFAFENYSPTRGQIVLLNTQALPGFYNLDLRALIDQGVIDAQAEVIQVCTHKIIREHREERGPGPFVASLDVYYNRRSTEAGKWHRDAHMHEMTEYASLEFFGADGTYFLGPEILHYPLRRDEVIGVIISDAQIEAFLQELHTRPATQLTTPLRCLGTDGTVFMFDNLSVIHATPITQTKTSTENVPNYNMFPGRNEISRVVTTPHGDTTLHELVAITRDSERSFIRSWIRRVPVMPAGRALVQPFLDIHAPDIDDAYEFTPESMDELHRITMGGEKSQLVNFKIQAPFLTKMHTWLDIPHQQATHYIKNEGIQLKNIIQLLRKQKKSYLKGGRKKTRRKKKNGRKTR